MRQPWVKTDLEKQLVYIVCRDCRRVFIFGEDAEEHKDQTGHQEFQSQEFEKMLGGAQDVYLRVILQQAIISSLKSLGERVMNSVIWHLNNNHILIDSNNLDISKFYHSLQDIIGPSADAVMESAMRHLLVHYKINTGTDLLKKIDSLPEMSSDEKLLYLIEMISDLRGWR